MDEQALKIIRKDLGEIVEVVGAFKQDKNKCKPIRVTFLRCYVRDKVFKNKKNLKVKVIQ